MSLGPCGSEFADLHPLPAFFPIFSVFHHFGSIGDLPLLQHQIHGTNEVWAEVGGLPPGIPHTPRRTVWWEWTAPAARLWALRIATGTDHYLAIYRDLWTPRALPTALTAAQPALFQANAGEVFQIGVYGMDGLGGNLEFRIQEASTPRLTQPTLQRDGAGRLWWDFAVPTGWDLPFQAEASSDLRIWTPIASGTGTWHPGAGSLRIPFEPEITGFFLRLRVGPP